MQLAGSVVLAMGWGLALSLPAVGQAPAVSGVIGHRQVTIDGTQRSYSFYLPRDLPAGSPLLIVLHGSASSGRYDIEHNRWREKADSEGFAVVAPDALANYDGVEPRGMTGPRDWARATLRWWRGQNVARWNGGFNDTTLVLRAVEDMAALTPIDHTRLYAVGFSRGGFFAHGLALKLPERIAAVAVLSPNLEPELKTKPARPVPFLLVGGTRDDVMQVGGPRPGEILDRWRTIDRCPPLAKADAAPSGLSIEAAGPCAEASEVRYIVATDVGHEWPLSAINYTDLTWDFLRRFTRHPQP